MFCLVILVAVPLWLRQTSAAPVPVRFVEGVTHGFLVLRDVNGALLASGNLLQVQRGVQVESRMVFRFKDGSLYDETVVFIQERVFTMQSYRLVQRGPAFAEDTEISLERATGKYRVSTKAHKDGDEQVLNGTLDLPPERLQWNGHHGRKESPQRCQRNRPHRRIHAHSPPHPTGVYTGGRAKGANWRTGENCNPLRVETPARDLAQGLRHSAKTRAAGFHAWIISDELPAFVRFEGPLVTTGPVADQDDTPPLARRAKIN